MSTPLRSNKSSSPLHMTEQRQPAPGKLKLAVECSELEHFPLLPNHYYGHRKTAAGKLKAGSSELEHLPLHPPCSPSTPNHFYGQRKPAPGKLKMADECSELEHFPLLPNHYYGHRKTSAGKLKAGSSELEHIPLHPPCSPSTPNHFYCLGRAMIIMASLVMLMMSASVDAQTDISITLLHSAVPKGAVCLDGSAPAYSYTEGFGNGSTSWIVLLQGGGWCTTVEDCSIRSLQRNGSSLHFLHNNTLFTGLFDLNDTYNPKFYNWHKVFVYYCDGASFMADVEHPVKNLMFRGGRIFKVMMEEMLSKGMKNATNAILTGGSAGGLATCLHCDSFGALFPATTRVKCISDSGFFFHMNRTDGQPDSFAQVIATHELAKLLPRSCTSRMDPSLCLNPENFIGDLKTPIFLLESAFDSIQISYSLVPPGQKHSWYECLNNISLCNSTELRIMRDFRALFIKNLLDLDHSPSRGMFVHSYYRHGHLLQRGGWTCSFVYGNTLANKSIGEAVSDWYFDGTRFEMIDAQHDIPLLSMNDDTPFLNQQCLASLVQKKSIAFASYQLQISNKLLCVLAQLFIALLLY